MSKLDALWEYQAVELKKEAFEREVLGTPARVRLKKLHGFLTEQQAAILRLQNDIAQKQSAMEKLQEQLERLNKDIDLEHSEFEQMLQDEECTAEELTECRQNHEKLLSVLSVTRKELSEMLHWLKGAMAEYKSTRNEASAAKKEYDQICALCDEEMQNSKERRAELEAELEAQAAMVDAQLLEKYKRVKRNHNAPMAKVESDQCGGCNMSLPMVVVKKVIGSDGIVECDNCGRILYVK